MDPGFFLGGGAPLRNDLNLVPCCCCCFFFWGRIPLISESRSSSHCGRGGTPPLDPPPDLTFVNELVQWLCCTKFFMYSISHLAFSLYISLTRCFGYKEVVLGQWWENWITRYEHLSLVSSFANFFFFPFGDIFSRWFLAYMYLCWVLFLNLQVIRK